MSSSHFSGKVIAVTGAASGIGKATAELLFARGATLALADINGHHLKDVASTLSSSAGSGQKVISTVVDVSKTEQVNDWFDEIKNKLSRLDGAANVAGVVHKLVPLKEMTDEMWNGTVGVNAKGIFNCLRAELNHIVSGGAIASVASVAGLSGVANMAAYVASKHAVAGLTKTAAQEAGAMNVRINAVAPGFVNTPLLQAAMAEVQNMPAEKQGAGTSLDVVAMGRMAQPEEVAKLIVYLLSDDASYVSGQIVRVDGAYQG